MSCVGCAERSERFIALMKRLMGLRKIVDERTPEEVERESKAVAKLEP